MDSYEFSKYNFTVTNGNNTVEKNETIFTTVLDNKAIVTMYISVFFNDSRVLFANKTINV